MLAPSLALPAQYEDLLIRAAYPFSVVPDSPVTRTEFFAIMRDTYAGTDYDLSKQVRPRHCHHNLICRDPSERLLVTPPLQFP